MILHFTVRIWYVFSAGTCMHMVRYEEVQGSVTLVVVVLS